jgi:serine/threonine-protein kinase
MHGTLHENRTPIAWILAPILVTMLLGAVSNALDVQFIPDRIRDWWQTGIRDRLWSGRAGEWLARRLGAPEQSRTVGGGAFRATEAALGLAAGELFAALPQPYRERLVELPATVAALEARAVAARAEIDMLAALAPSGSGDGEALGHGARRPRRTSRRAWRRWRGFDSTSCVCTPTRTTWPRSRR